MQYEKIANKKCGGICDSSGRQKGATVHLMRIKYSIKITRTCARGLQRIKPQRLWSEASNYNAFV